jgi:CRP-like cAMP-binding protein
MSNFRHVWAKTVGLAARDLDVLKAGWFGGLPEQLQTRIAARSRLTTFAKGEFLIRQGDVARGLYGLLAGRTHHFRQVSESEDVLLHVGEPGLWVGEYPLLSGDVAVGSVVAAAPSRTLFLPAHEFEAIIDEQPRYLRHFARLLASRFGVAYRFLAESHGLTPENWLLSRLRGILDIQRAGASAEPPLDTVSISQSQLANMIGLSRQTLNMLLARLAKRGLIEVGFRSIRVRSRSGA